MAPLDFPGLSFDREWYWVKVTVSHVAGKPMLSLFNPHRNVLSEEVGLTEADDARDYYFEFRNNGFKSLLLRNGEGPQRFLGRNSCDRNPCHAGPSRVRGTLKFPGRQGSIRSSPPCGAFFMKILVTGGAGYVGSRVVAHLLSQGHQVRVLDRLLYGAEAMLPLTAMPSFELQVGDVRDRDSMLRAMQGMDGGHSPCRHCR